MAKGKSEANGKVDFDKVVWVIDNLDTKELAVHDKKPYAGDAMLDAIMGMIDKGFKISLRFDDYSKSYMASAVCLDTRYENAGLAISARGNDIGDCTSIMLWKFFQVAQQDLRGFADKVPTGVRG